MGCVQAAEAEIAIKQKIYIDNNLIDKKFIFEPTDEERAQYVDLQKIIVNDKGVITDIGDCPYIHLNTFYRRAIIIDTDGQETVIGDPTPDIMLHKELLESYDPFSPIIIVPNGSIIDTGNCPEIQLNKQRISVIGHNGSLIDVKTNASKKSKHVIIKFSKMENSNFNLQPDWRLINVPKSDEEIPTIRIRLK